MCSWAVTESYRQVAGINCSVIEVYGISVWFGNECWTLWVQQVNGTGLVLSCSLNNVEEPNILSMVTSRGDSHGLARTACLDERRLFPLEFQSACPPQPFSFNWLFFLAFQMNFYSPLSRFLIILMPHELQLRWRFQPFLSHICRSCRYNLYGNWPTLVGRKKISELKVNWCFIYTFYAVPLLQIEYLIRMKLLTNRASFLLLEELLEIF